MTPEREAAHCDAMWIAIAQLAEEGPRTTNELLGRCICWGRLAPSTRRVYLLCALSEAEDLGLVTSRYERRDGARHRVFEVVPGSRGIVHAFVRRGRWVNHPGSGVMAWDARRVPLPARPWPHRNATDMQVAVWAQLAGVPIWLVPHPARWLSSLASLDPDGIFMTSKATGHALRNRLLREHGDAAGWALYRAEPIGREAASQ